MSDAFTLPAELPPAPEAIGIGLEVRKLLEPYFVEVLRLNQPIDTARYPELVDQVWSTIIAQWDIVKTDAQKRLVRELVNEVAMEVLSFPRELKLLQLGNANPGYRKVR